MLTQRWRDDEQQTEERRARRWSAVMAELAEYGHVHADKASLEQLLDSIGADPDASRTSRCSTASAKCWWSVASRRDSPNAACPPLRARPRLPERGTASLTIEHTLAGQKYLELDRAGRRSPASALRDVRRQRATARGGDAQPRRAPPIGYIRLGLTLDVQRKQFREQMVGAIGVVSLLVVLADRCATLLLTRRLVAPMRRLMRAARAVGSGRLDVYVPAGSSDELGLLTHTFNHMTQKLSEVAVGGRQLPAHARGEGRAAHARARGRHGARLQARAARHPDRPAQPVAPQPAPEADPRAGAARRHARRLPVPRLRSLQADQRHAGPRCRRPAAAGRSRSGSPTRCANRTPWRASAATNSS